MDLQTLSATQQPTKYTRYNRLSQVAPRQWGVFCFLFDAYQKGRRSAVREPPVLASILQIKLFGIAAEQYTLQFLPSQRRGGAT